MKTILLCTSAAPLQTPFSTVEKRPPLGMGFLISVLRNAGHDVFFIDNYLKPSNFLETDYLQRNRIEYVGIYANTICYRDTLRMLHRLEYLRLNGKWKGKIVLGGPHTSVAVDTIPDFVDFIVQGEGEEAILDILEGRAQERILRLPPIKDLDQLPVPAWDYFIHHPYRWSMDWLPEKPVFTMNTSRGCPFSCTFCSVCSIWGRRYRYFSAERVIAEIEHLIRNYGAKGIYFREDNFTLNRKRLVGFCEGLLKKNIKIQWACESRVDNLDAEVLRLMHRAGARAFYFGVESGSQRMLDFLQKGITVEKIRETFRLCHEIGLKTAASIVVGIPGETAEDLMDTEKLLRDVKPDVIWQNVFVGIPRSELYSYVLDRKLYDFIDDRGLVYLKGHNKRVKQFYKDAWDASIPYSPEKPALSVIMSVRNGENHVEKAIRSILTQSFQDFEFIIVDDASTDVTLRVIEGLEDPRIRILKNPENLGLTKSLNKALLQARGKYIARMDADDISLPHRLETQYRFLERHPEYALVGSSYYEMNDRDEKVSIVTVLLDDAALREGLKRQNWFGHGSVMMRRDALETVGRYDERFVFAQDYDLWLRISEHYKVANIEEPLYCWRRSEGAISQKRQAEQQHFARMARKEAQIRGRKKEGTEIGQPLVSVIVPTFNRPDMLVETLKSILQQTFKDFEIIVVNDGGADVEDRVKALNRAQNIKYIRHERNRGLAAARNTGIRLARGKYIAYLDDDDVYYPDHLKTLVSHLESGSHSVAYTDAHRTLQEKRNGGYRTVKKDIPYSFDFDYERILRDNFIPVLCVMHRKSCLGEVGLFDETLKSLEDWDLWMRMSRKFEFAHIPKVTCAFTWREDGSTMTTGRSGEMAQARSIVTKRGMQLAREGVIHPDENGHLEEARGNLVSIVILTFNELDYTKRCVDSIRKNTPEPHEVIFVDNGSKDGTVNWLRRLVVQNSNYKLIENRENLGFARGCNQGIKASKGEYILLLNNDVLVTENWLTGMLEHLNSAPDTGIVGPMTNNISGTQKVAGVTYKAIGDLEDYARQFRTKNRYRRVTSRRLVGFCMLFRRGLVKEIGPLDESFGTGNFEDDDFCLRAALAGYRNVIAGDVFIHHFGSRSFIGNRINYGTALTGNRKIFDDKWRGVQLDDAQGRRCLVLKNIEETRKQYQFGRLNKAVDLCLAAIKCVPSETKIYHELAEILIQTKNFKETLDVLREIPPERRSEKTWILTGFAKEGLNEDDAALTLAEKTLEHPETRAEAMNLKGILAYKKASLEEAASLFLQAIEVDPSYGEAHTNLGVVQWKKGPGEEALRFLEKGFILSPDVPDVANLYHSAAKNMGQLQRAEAIFREAKGLHPLNRTISFLLIDLLIGQEKFEEVMEEIERAMTLFEVDEGFLQAAVEIRSKVGPLEPPKDKKDRNTISLCMIVKNEEKNLIRCLSTIKGTVDEIIVVDTGSTDKTKDIASAFGAKVFDIPWRDDFSEARNLSLAKATGDWILVLDADEVIAPCDFVKMRNLTSHVRGGKARPTGFTLTTRNYSAAMNTQGWIPNDGSYANEEAGPGWFPSRKVRLFRKDPRIRFKGAVHELVEDSMNQHKLKIHSSDIPVHHYGILPAKDGVDKREAYYQLGKKKIDESGGNARAIYELAIQAARLRRYDEAADLWNRFFDSGFKGDLHLAHMNRGHVYLETGRYAEAAEACEKALEIAPELKEAHLNLAMSEFYMGRPKEAAEILDNLIRKIPDYIPARALLAAALILTGETDRYKATIDHIRTNNMNPAVFFQAYAKKLLSAGREEDGARLLKAARGIWRALLKSRLKSRSLEATDEEIERVMVIAARETRSSEGGLDEMTDDAGHQKREQTQHTPSPRLE